MYKLQHQGISSPSIEIVQEHWLVSSEVDWIWAIQRFAQAMSLEMVETVERAEDPQLSCRLVGSQVYLLVPAAGDRWNTYT